MHAMVSWLLKQLGPTVIGTRSLRTPRLHRPATQNAWKVPSAAADFELVASGPQPGPTRVAVAFASALLLVPVCLSVCESCDAEWGR